MEEYEVMEKIEDRLLDTLYQGTGLLEVVRIRHIFPNNGGGILEAWVPANMVDKDFLSDLGWVYVETTGNFIVFDNSNIVSLSHPDYDVLLVPAPLY